jgi:hypothetical protein
MLALQEPKPFTPGAVAKILRNLFVHCYQNHYPGTTIIKGSVFLCRAGVVSGNRLQNVDTVSTKGGKPPICFRRDIGFKVLIIKPRF